MLFFPFQTASHKLHDFLQFVFMYLTWFFLVQYPCFLQERQRFFSSLQRVVGSWFTWIRKKMRLWLLMAKYIITKIYCISIWKIDSYLNHDFDTSWMGIPCKQNTGSSYCSFSAVYYCSLCLCCNTIFLCCTHICVSSGIFLK